MNVPGASPPSTHRNSWPKHGLLLWSWPPAVLETLRVCVCVTVCVCVCVCVCMCVCVYVCCVCVFCYCCCLWLFVYMCLCVCLCVCVWQCVCVCICGFFLLVCLFICVYVCVCLCQCVCLCVFETKMRTDGELFTCENAWAPWGTKLVQHCLECRVERDSGRSQPSYRTRHA